VRRAVFEVLEALGGSLKNLDLAAWFARPNERLDGLAPVDLIDLDPEAVVDAAHAYIVANPTMIESYKAGVPGNGKPFPEGSKIAKLQWSFKKSTDAPFVVDVPDAPTQAFLIEKDSKRFPTTGG
jgi:hypothetical protein